MNPTRKYPCASAINMSRAVCLATIVCAWISPDIWAQTTQLGFETIEVPSRHINVHSGVEDDDGFIWFGSYDGLYRYNGRDFTRFNNDPFDSTSLTFGRPLYVVKGNHNDLWIGTTNGGVSRLDLNTYKFESFRHRLLDPGSLCGNDIGGLFVDPDGTIWVGSDEFCLSKITWPSRTIQRFYPDTSEIELSYRKYSRYLGLIIDDKQQEDILWIGAPFGVYAFKKSTGTFKLYRSPTNQTQYKPIPVSLYADDDGIIWAGSAQGIARIDPKSNTVLQIPLRRENYSKETVGGWKPIAIHGFSEDELAIMTHYDGLVIYNKTSGERHLVNNDIRLGRGSNFYMKDSRGNIWIETNGTLLIHSQDFSEARKISLNDLPGLNWSRAFLTVPAKNGLYIGTYWGAGLLYADFDTREVSGFAYQFDAAMDRDVYMMDLTWTSDSMICIASDGGLLEFDRSAGSITRIVDKTNTYTWDEITSVCGCGHKVWFAAAYEGLFSVVYDETGHHPGTSIPTSLKITDLRCSADALIIGTTTGLFQMTFGSQDLESIIPDIHVSELILSGDSMWISTLGQGLFVLEMKQTEGHHQYASSLSSGVNVIYTFIRDDQGTFWLNTDGGTVHFNAHTGEYVTYLEMGIGRRSPIAQLQNGMIVSGGYQALTYFRPEDLSHRGLPPKPYFTKIDIANHEEAFNLAPDRLERIVLKPNQRELTVEFDAINFNDIATTDFEYVLHGWNDAWQSLGRQRYLNVSNLNSGEYLLEIRATNAYGGMSEANKQLSIIVLPPVYHHLWFQALAVLALGICSFLVIRYFRRRMERKQETERKERQLLAVQKEMAELKLTALQAQMNPHFIFNSLNSINWYILKNRPAEASMYLTKFSKLVRRILDNSKNLSVPLQFELEVLRLYLELEAMRFENTFDYEIQTDDEIDLEEVLIPPLILQPFVENAIWHGLMHKEHKGNLLIQIYQENGHLKCIVQDDGIGRRASQRMNVKNPTTHESKGIKLTTERIKLAHKDYLNENSIRVIDLVGADGEAAGTRVEVLLPYE